jgi:hypothetical protein
MLPETPRPLRIRPPIELEGGATFRGEAPNRVPTGYGTITYLNGDTFVGDVVNGLPDGQGVYTSADGGRTRRGQWLKGRMCGRACQQLPDNWLFDGTCQNDAAHGPGTLFHPRGFLLRGQFAGGLAHGPTHIRYVSRDSFLGTLDAGKLAANPSIVRYADGRLALRLTRAGVAHLVPVSGRGDALYGQLLLKIEQAVAHEHWDTLLQLRDEQQRQQHQLDGPLVALAWSLEAWQPCVPWVEALQDLAGLFAAQAAAGGSVQHELLRGLLHLAGPARPFRTVGNIETVTHHMPHQAYPNQMAFVAHAMLPYCGSSRLVLGDSSQLGAPELVFPYIFEAEPGYAQRFALSMHRLCDLLTESWQADIAHDGVAGSHSMRLLARVLDAAGRLDLSAVGIVPPSPTTPLPAVLAPPPVVAPIDRARRAPVGNQPEGAYRSGWGGRSGSHRPTASSQTGDLLAPPTLLPTTFEMPSPTRPGF